MKTLPFLLLLTACGAAHSDAPPPEWVIGKYHYSGSGTVVKKFPWEARADLILERNGQYELTVTVHVDDEKGGDTDTDASYGTYYVEGNRLYLQSASDDDGDVDEFEIRGSQLVPKIGWPARLALRGFRIPDPVFVKTAD